MAESLVIVAIPSSDSPVWKVSSEKVPHLTLLYLGAEEVGPETARIVSFLEHAADTMLAPFGLTVDYRGPLGNDKADVLFFEKGWQTKKLEDFRSSLLGDQKIFELYNSVEQFPSWTPHLTLGYPETPARPDDRDYPGIDYVAFDTVALWTGDYEGPQFRLNSDYSDYEVAMSGTVNQGKKAVENVLSLAHYGVPGMKWGVRRSQAQLARAAKVREAATDDARAKIDVVTKAKSSGTTNALTNSELKTAIDRMNLETQYSRLVDQTTPKSKGRIFVDAMLGDAKGIARTQSTNVAKAATSIAVEKEFRKRGRDDIADRIKPKKK